MGMLRYTEWTTHEQKVGSREVVCIKITVHSSCPFKFGNISVIEKPKKNCFACLHILVEKGGKREKWNMRSLSSFREMCNLKEC